jgi:hypothetical protein
LSGNNQLRSAANVCYHWATTQLNAVGSGRGSITDILWQAITAFLQLVKVPEEVNEHVQYL